MIKETADKENMMRKLQEQRQFMGRRFRMSNEILILRFFKFLITKLPDRNVIFDVSKGSVINKAGGDARVQKTRITRDKSHLFISVKDPFLKKENHGVHMREENNFKRFLTKLKQFIREASQGRLEDFLLDSEAEQDDDEDRKYAQEEAINNSKMEWNYCF